VAFLGRFVSDKGADLLIQAFAQCKEESVGLTLIGSGPEEQELRRLADTLGVHVRFTGALQGKDLVRELNKHEILAVPSRWPEPFGNVALEGMGCGCVVVGSEGGGLPDAIGTGGLTFRSGDAGHLAQHLRRLLGDAELRQELRLRSEEHLRKHVEEAVCRRYLEAIEAFA
jgi:glycosyltransferase involved in cell wall biosynthesis